MIFSQICKSNVRWGKFANLWCSDYWNIHLQVNKLNLAFILMLPCLKSQQVIIPQPSRGKLLLPPGSIFSKIYHPSRIVGGNCIYYWWLKMTLHNTKISDETFSAVTNFCTISFILLQDHVGCPLLW